MDIFKDLFKKKFYGNYRAKIVSINTDLQNGIYVVRVYPMHAKMDDNKLPKAVSNMTVHGVKYGKHINIDVNDWVWVFFENGDPDIPIIFDFCNIKDKYPEQCKGENWDHDGNFSKDDNIQEPDVSYDGEYNSTSGFNFGDNIHIEFDEKNTQMIITTSKHQMIFDKDGNWHLHLSNSAYMSIAEKLNIHAGNVYVKIDEKLDVETGSEINITGNDVLNIETLKDISVKTNNNLNLESTFDTSIKGLNINNEAQVEIKHKSVLHTVESTVTDIKADSMCKIDGGGMTNIKGLSVIVEGTSMLMLKAPVLLLGSNPVKSPILTVLTHPAPMAPGPGVPTILAG